MPDRILYSDDCLNVLNDELAIRSGSVDLIYLDPKSTFPGGFWVRGVDSGQA